MTTTDDRRPTNDEQSALSLVGSRFSVLGSRRG
jgi:hypothetical protein